MKKQFVVVAAAVALLGAWYAFRPEKLFINEKIHEGFPATATMAAAPAGPVSLSAGRFHGVAHEGRGMAALYQFPEGNRVLRLSEFNTSNGPQLHVYLSTAPDASDSDTVKNAETLDLGPLKGNQGDQNYVIPAGTDVAKFKSVIVWCKRFSVNFATAPLNQKS